ncbi:type II secretion system F family protein, partial [Kineococcus glutinatus]|uniref:type II secretion system F family protein n=1 Tax=Kineococcus glutinatus TaxID=1070872 RepID=UPI0031E52C95
MTGVLLGLLLGAGAFCVWSSFTPARPARRRQARTGRLARLLAEAGAPGVPPATLLGACAGCAVVVFLGGLAVTGVPAVAGCFAVLAGWAPLSLVRWRAARRRTQVRELWPDVVDHLASGVRGGLSLPEAVAALAERGPEELRSPFGRFAARHRASGGFERELDALGEELADPVADRLLAALRMARQVGGTDLGRLLRTLSAFLREEARVRGELQARQSWTLNGARLAVAAPWVVLALLATRPEAVQAYSSPA